MRPYTKYLWLLLAIAILTGCRTQKKKGELSGLGRVYHNTTSHYNYFYNAEVLYNESKQALSDQHQENYNKILPLFKYRQTDNPKSVAENLDRASEKLSVAIALHRDSDWADDCYLLIGKCQYLKQDFEAAEETLEFLTSEFSPSAVAKKKSKSSKSVKQRKKSSKKKKTRNMSLKKRKKLARKERENTGGKDKKEEEITATNEPLEAQDITPGKTTISIGGSSNMVEEGKPDSYFLKHRPAYQEAILWLARTYIERENYPEADRLLQQLDKNPSTFKDVRSELAVVQAYYFITQKKYPLAVEPLEKAIELAEDKYDKARYSFIVAQIYQILKNEDLAYSSFERVVKLRPSYEMEFSARLRMAQNAWATGNSTVAEALKELNRMLKDEKNEDYEDQIYFSMAKIHLSNNEIDAGIANLRKSLQAVSSNPANKAEAYYTLAELYYEREDYVDAKFYYDSTLTALAQTDERYSDVKRLSENLTDIAANLQTIELQDSLLRISAMPEEEQRALAFEIKQRQEEERRRQILQKAAGAAPTGGNPLAGNNFSQIAGQGAQNTFWAYDDRAVKRGVRDFERKWGTRPLDDNWRRSATNSIAEVEDPEEVEEAISSVLTDEDFDRIFQDVPRTQQEILAANNLIMEAYFNLGKLYRDRLKKSEKAIEALETLFERFPDNPYELEAYYFLYLAHTDLDQTAKAKVYYQKIISKYPDTPIGRALLDPDYVKNTMDKERQLNNYYDATLAAFSNQKYQEAFDRISNVGQEFGATNSHQARFALLKAMCIGNLKGRDEYIYALKEVVAKFPETPEEKRAKEILRLLGAVNASVVGNNNGIVQDPNQSPFKIEYETIHYIIVAFDGSIDLTQAKVAVSDFNKQYYKLEKLRISNIYLGDSEARVPLIVIRRFDDKVKAMDYYQTVEKNKQAFMSGDTPYSVFAVSQTNYRELLRNKTLTGYPEFFELHYLE